jgi:hypothetical protein
VAGPPRAKLPAPLEKFVQREILRLAAEAGVPLWPTDAGAFLRATRGRRGGAGVPAGFPDLSGLLPGVGPRYAIPVYVEVKRKGEKPTGLQRQWLEHLELQGALVAWFDDPADARAWFERIKREVMK